MEMTRTMQIKALMTAGAPFAEAVRYTSGRFDAELHRKAGRAPYAADFLAVAGEAYALGYRDAFGLIDQAPVPRPCCDATGAEPCRTYCPEVLDGRWYGDL